MTSEQRIRKDNPEYKIWQAMKTRCLNTNSASYKNYGARGIRICDKWINDFEAFFADVGRRPDHSYSIDRINNDGDYEPDNVRWATRSEQSRNTRRTTHIIYQGRRLSFLDAISAAGSVVTESTARRRISAFGWSPVKAIETPIHSTRTIHYQFRGSMMTIREIMNMVGCTLSYQRVHKRIANGWDVEAATTIARLEGAALRKSQHLGALKGNSRRYGRDYTNE